MAAAVVRDHRALSLACDAPFTGTLHDLGVRQDPIVAIVVFTIAAAGSAVSVWYLLRF
jgi:hypothetical protein